MTQSELVPVKPNEKVLFDIWQTRFVNEYNRSQQFRKGYKLIAGTNIDHWNLSFENNTGPIWIRVGNHNIGFISPNIVTIGNYLISEETQLPYVCDVYIDRRFRGKGLLTWALTKMRERGTEVICIDRKKIEDNAGYYWALGFRFFVPWQENELLLVSPTQHSPDWQRCLPDTFED